jgi:hypothetical protein
VAPRDHHGARVVVCSRKRRLSLSAGVLMVIPIEGSFALRELSFIGIA